jgi:hypothetical protein
VRRAGLADNLIDACGYHRNFSLWPIYLDGKGEPHELDLRTGEMWLLNRKEQPCDKTQM